MRARLVLALLAGTLVRATRSNVPRQAVAASLVGVLDRDSQPLFLDPPGGHHTSPSPSDDSHDSHDSHETASASPSPDPTTSATASKKQDHSTSSADKSKTTAPASSTAASQTSTESDTTSSTSSESQSASASSEPASIGDSKQLKSIEYLIPVFVLVLISFCGWLYSRWYAHKHRNDEAYTIPPVPPFQSRPPAPGDPDRIGFSDAGGRSSGWSITRMRSSRSGQWRSGGMGRNGWKSLDDCAEEDEMVIEKVEGDPSDPWYAGEADLENMQWQDVELGVNRYSGGNGASATAVPEDRNGRAGPEVVVQDESGDMGGRGSYLDRWRSTFDIWRSARRRGADPALSGLPMGKTVRLVEPTRYTSLSGEEFPAPSAPEWIMPRTGISSPTQLLSPPNQPHLFFHPSHPTRPSKSSCCSSDMGSASNGSLCASSSSSEEVSILGQAALNAVAREECAHARWPTIPSSATALAEATGNAYTTTTTGTDNTPYTSVPGRSPRTPKTPKTKGSAREGTSLSTMKRSNGRMDLSGREPDTPTPKRPIRSAFKGSRMVPAVRPPSASLERTPTKRSAPPRGGDGVSRTPTSHAQRRDAKAQKAVNDILQASWSDRLLASPPQSIDGLMALTVSPSPFSALGDGTSRSDTTR